MKPTRNDAIDMLRGLVMVLMVLDHARDFIMGFGDPTDLATTTVPLFLTRWITHLCAPVFVLLAGTSAWLFGRSRPRAELRRLLLTRGLWLVVLELTVIKFAWAPEPFYAFVLLQVIWAIGWSMIVLGLLCGLRVEVIGAIGLVIVLGHNLLDPIVPADLGGLGWLWTLVHERGDLSLRGGHQLFASYPVLPWVGVMALGYALGPVLVDESRRRRILLTAGLGMIAAFVILRASNLYGDPDPWSVQARPVFTVFSFINCEKYPPSLCFLLMTLGPALILLWLFDRRTEGPLARRLIIYGRVPLFYYVAHLYMLRLAGVILALARFGADAIQPPPGPAGTPLLPLPWVYLAWFLTVLALAPLSRKYGEFKRSRDDWWMRYL